MKLETTLKLCFNNIKAHERNCYEIGKLGCDIETWIRNGTFVRCENSNIDESYYKDYKVTIEVNDYER